MEDYHYTFDRIHSVWEFETVYDKFRSKKICISLCIDLNNFVVKLLIKKFPGVSDRAL